MLDLRFLANPVITWTNIERAQCLEVIQVEKDSSKDQYIDRSFNKTWHMTNQYTNNDLLLRIT